MTKSLGSNSNTSSDAELSQSHYKWTDCLLSIIVVNHIPPIHIVYWEDLWSICDGCGFFSTFHLEYPSVFSRFCFDTSRRFGIIPATHKNQHHELHIWYVSLECAFKHSATFRNVIPVLVLVLPVPGTGLDGFVGCTYWSYTEQNKKCILKFFIWI